MKVRSPRPTHALATLEFGVSFLGKVSGWPRALGKKGLNVAEWLRSSTLSPEKHLTPRTGPSETLTTLCLLWPLQRHGVPPDTLGAV